MTMHCACGNEERECGYPNCHTGERDKKSRSDGSTASYYELPLVSTQLQHLISHRNMNAQIGEIFRACYRYGQASHSDQLRDAKKMKFYAEAEIERLEALDRGTLARQPACKHSIPASKSCPVCEKEKLQDATRQLKPGFSDGELALKLLCPRHQEYYGQGTGCHQCKTEIQNG
ncbi:hypothetical protein D3C78_1119080 [compost metagenome]